MAITVKHTKVSTVPDGDDTSVVRPSDWNADHQLTGTIPIANGGTNATTASDALTNLGAYPASNPAGYGTGTVTSVSGTAPVNVATGTTTPVISLSTTGSGNVVLATGATQANPTISNYENFTPTTAPAYSEGRVWYDSTEKALAFYNDSSALAVHVSQDLIFKVINNTGSTIPNGSPVYITGTSSGQSYPNVALAKADVAATSSVIGLTNGAIANGATGYVTSQGTIDNVNTSTFTVGQVLYLSPYSAGQLMNTVPPTGITVQVGIATYIDSSAGHIYVKQTTPLAVPASIITGTLGVDHGGTGATTLTGYVKGSGTSALTASSTIPTTDLSGTVTNAQLANSAITINGTSTSLGGSISVGTVTSVTGTSPVVSSGGNTPAISMPAATSSVNGYLTSADWTTFNGKQPAGTYVTSVAATSPVTSSGGTTPTIAMPAATTSVSGYLTSTDWNTFNNKGSGTVTSVTGTAPVVSSGGATPAISMAAATGSVNGYLTSADWTTFNNKGSGTVTAVSVVSANGFTGTSSGGATPALTLTTSITGMLKGNGTAISAGTAGSDYVAPATATSFTAQQYFGNVALTDGATISWAANTAQVATFTFVSSNRTMGAPTGLVSGAYYGLAVIQNGGSNTLTWNSVFKWAGGTAPTLSTAAGAKDYFVFRTDGTNMYEQGRSLGVA